MSGLPSSTPSIPHAESADTVPSTPERAPPEFDCGAWRDSFSYVRFLGIGLGGLALDLWSKHWAFETMGQRGRRVLIPHVLEYQTMLNPGALFGVGGGRTTLFLLASVFALALVIWMFVQSSPKRWLLHIALGGIFAGALGNMYDRATVRLYFDRARGAYLTPIGEDERGFVFQEFPPGEGKRTRVLDESPALVGYVRDFIKIPTKIWGERDLWPWVFNVADTLLVGGVGILAIYFWRDRKNEVARESLDEPQAPAKPAPD